MGIELIEFDIGSETYEGRLTERDEAADEGVVMLPGAGHGPFGNIFDIAAYELAGDGKRVFRVETWESREELEAKTLGELHEEVDAAVDYLASNGCSTVHLIAKSFGGGIALSHVPDAVDGLLLWAPAVEIGVDAADATDPDEEIGEDEDLLIGVEDVDVDVPVRVLVGDEDRGVSVDDCRRIADAVDDGDVTVIPGENHSFNENRTAVVEHTLRYLSAES